MQFENRNIGAIIQEWATIDSAAVSVEYQGHRHTRADIMNATQSLAAVFRRAGIQPGASVALLMGEPLRGIEAMIALWSLGVTVLFLDPRQPPDEISRAREQAKIDEVFTDLPSFARRGTAQLIASREAIEPVDTTLTFPKGSHASDAFILSSSGTTDFPRFRRVSHQEFVHNLIIGGQLIGVPEPVPAVMLGSLAFGAKLGHWIRMLIHGCFVLSLPIFSRTEELHRALERPDIQAVGLPPVVIRDLLAFHKPNNHDRSLPLYPNITRMTSLGGPISDRDLLEAYRVLTPGIRNLYSMTGVGGVSTLAGEDILRKSGSVGKPLPTVTVRIEDANGHALPYGQTGRIIATPDWKTNAQPVNTGDIGWLDEDGYLFVSGRDVQSATRNAVNVHLGDLEEVVRQLHDIRDCIAFSVHDDDTPDDRIYLAVETAVAADLTCRQIKATLAAYRRPDKILVSDALPRTASNKIALRVLREAAQSKENGFVDI